MPKFVLSPIGVQVNGDEAEVLGKDLVVEVKL